MAKKFISVGNIKELETLANKAELLFLDIYQILSSIEIIKTTSSGTKPNAKINQIWYDQEADQLFYRRPNGTDKLIG